jgi:hypothetical protein
MAQWSDAMFSMLTVGDVARQIGDRRGVQVPPQKVSDLIYRRKVDATRCPVVCGVRRIPADLIPAIESALEERGILAEAVHRAS